MPTYNPNSDRFLTVANALTNNGMQAVRFILDIPTNIFYTLDDDNNFTMISSGAIEGNVYSIAALEDFPTADINDEIHLPEGAYWIKEHVDLTDKRIVCDGIVTIFGSSSESSSLTTTNVNAMIESAFTLPILNISLTAPIAIALSGAASAYDFQAVNFVDCPVIGTVNGCGNFVFINGSFLNSGGLTFDGSIGTIAFNNSLFNNAPITTAIIISATCVITRRFRIIYSSFVTLAGETSINVSNSATIPVEAFILDTVNFSGGGTYVDGLDNLSNKTLFINCTNLKNTSVHGQLYMKGNVTATVIGNTTDYYKVLGTTTPYDDNEKFSHSNNRLTCEALIQREYRLSMTCSFIAGNNNELDFAFYNSRTGAIIPASVERSTANTAGRAENVSLMALANLQAFDYIEVWVRNTSAAVNVTLTHLNVVINEI